MDQTTKLKLSCYPLSNVSIVIYEKLNISWLQSYIFHMVVLRYQKAIKGSWGYDYTVCGGIARGEIYS